MQADEELDWKILEDTQSVVTNVTGRPGQDARCVVCSLHGCPGDRRLYMCA